MKGCCYRKKPLLYRFFQYIIFIMIGLILLSYIYHNSSLYYRKSITMPFSMHLTKNDIYMLKGEETHIAVFGLNKRVSFYSTNFKVVGVNFNGRLYAYRTGKAFIIAKVGKHKLKCRVHVIDINKTKVKIKEGGSCRLKITGAGAFASWKSSDKSIASVNSFGRVKGIRKGRAVITAKVKGRELKCVVYVR